MSYSYGGYNAYGDYDAYEHMTSDPVHFATYGYGGFGYDTSHVPQPQSHSELYHLAAKGNAQGVADLVEKTKDPGKRAQLINHARRWTEVDYKDSGFTKEYEWFDLTPVAIAARNGHTDVLMYLLKKHADPTLRGCYTEDAYATTEVAAKLNLDRMTSQFMNLRTQTSSPPFSVTLDGKTSQEKAREVYLSLKCAKYNVSLVEEALKFWQEAPYAHPRSTSGDRKKFTNKPKSGLEEALDAVEVPALCDDSEEANEIALIARTFTRHKEYFAAEDKKNFERMERIKRMNFERMERIKRNRAMQESYYSNATEHESFQNTPEPQKNTIDKYFRPIKKPRNNYSRRPT